MSPGEDAQLLLAIVRRHLSTLRIGLNPEYPQEERVFTAQQALETLLKASIVLADQPPPRTHELGDLSRLAALPLEPSLLELQVYAVEARCEVGPFLLPAPRQTLLDALEALLTRAEAGLPPTV